MRHPKIIIASISLAAAAAIGGGITAAAATTSHASSRPATSQHAAATVRTVQATVAGKTETVLVNSQGLPLYYYQSDTAAKSAVTGGLAALWPPLTSASPAATGLRRQARRGHGHPRRPGRLPRAPAVHLRRRPARPGDRPGSAGLLRGHPRPHGTHRVPDSDGHGPSRPGRPGRPAGNPYRLLTRQRALARRLRSFGRSQRPMARTGRHDHYQRRVSGRAPDLAAGAAVPPGHHGQARTPLPRRARAVSRRPASRPPSSRSRRWRPPGRRRAAADGGSGVAVRASRRAML